MGAVAKSGAQPEPTVQELEQFLYHEARLLDEQRWEEWIDLFVEEGEYWVPAAPDQPDPKNHISLIYENSLLRAVRIKRYRHPNAFSLQPKPRTVHFVTNVMYDGMDADSGEVLVNSRFLMLQYRREKQDVYGGVFYHRLRRAGGALKIVSKRVDLVNCDAPLDNILVYF
jgi:3-phenylpropionate/cinnamic acid dioxygenase small subunit